MPSFSHRLTLPRALLDQVDDPKKPHKTGKPGPRAFTNRKDQRQAEREQKKRGRVSSSGISNSAITSRNRLERIRTNKDENREHGNKTQPTLQRAHTKDGIETGYEESKTSGNLKKSHLRKAPAIERSQDRPSLTQYEKAKLAADDREIEALEKKLGVKKGEQSNFLEGDEFGALLDGLEENEDQPAAKRTRDEDDTWLRAKRRRLANSSTTESDNEVMEYHSTSEISDSASDDGSSLMDRGQDGSLSESVESFEDFESEHSDASPPPLKRHRENPYVAPESNRIEPTQKYVPPSKRGDVSSDAEIQQRLRRQIQGQLNRLSETNILSILSEVVNLYRSNPRQYVTSTLIDILLNLIADRTSLNGPFIILHAAFIAAVYKMQGQDFGAQIVEQIVSRFESFYIACLEQPHIETSKGVVNLVSVLSQLYNLQVIGSELIFDLIRKFLSSLSELHTELLLRLVRSSGSQLRSDDPSSLKDIVLLLQQTISSGKTDGISVRTQFMIESINDLKNNKLKAGAAASALTSEQLMRTKKILGSLNQRAGVRATEPLRFSLQDIHDADKHGKWWLVGASWKGNQPTKSSDLDDASMHENLNLDPSHGVKDAADNDGIDLNDVSLIPLARIAKQNNMNTPLRKSIFITLLSSADYIDAHTRLLKLNLTRTQELEIPRVLIHCTIAERDSYNPYYALVAARLCAGDKKRKLGRAFGSMARLFVKRLSGNSDEAEVEEDSRSSNSQDLELPAIVNQAKFWARLAAEEHVTIGILKLLNLQKPKHKASIFAEVLLVTLILHLHPITKSASTTITSLGQILFLNRPNSDPDFAKGLVRFLRKVVRKSDLVISPNEKDRLKAGIDSLFTGVGDVFESMSGPLSTSTLGSSFVATGARRKSTLYVEGD